MSRLALVLAGVTLTAATALAAPGGITGDPQVLAEWQAAQQKFNSATSWRSKRTVGASGQTFTLTSEFVAPDRMRMITATDPAGKPLSGTVRIGNDWWSFGPNACAKLPGRPPGQQRDDRESMQQPDGMTGQITKGSVETVGTVVTQTYTMTFSGGGVQGTQKMYVARDSGYPVRTETTYPQGSFTIDYFDYDAAITVNPPC